MLGSLRRLPFLKLLALAQTALLLRRHMQRLSASDRRRLTQLVRRGHHLNAAERQELGRIVGKLEPREFAFGAADKLSPVPLPRRLSGDRARRQ
jgi:hypothetical protein